MWNEGMQEMSQDMKPDLTHLGVNSCRPLRFLIVLDERNETCQM